MTYHCGDRAFDSLEEMMADHRSRMTRWDHVVSATWYPARRRSRDARRAVTHAYQRVVRGWDDTALWSLDDHLSKSLGEQLVEMAKIAHGYPGEHYPFDRWTADLKTHGEALLAYHRTHYDVHEEDKWTALYEPAQEALRWVAENLASLWD